MANNLDVKLVLEHLLNGDLEQSLCRICLQQLPQSCENIFTKICKEDQEYCVADVLEELCGIEFSETDNYFVCLECFLNASNAYNFYLKTKRNNEVLSFYVDEIVSNVNSIQIPETVMSDTLCISLPEFTPSTPYFDYNLDGILKQCSIEIEVPIKKEEQSPRMFDNEHIVIVKNEDGTQTFYRPLMDGNLVPIKLEKKDPYEHVEKKERKKREPMMYRQCSRCPIKYRFIAKLKEHMRTEHGIILNVCKICQALIEDLEEYRQHLKTHTNIHQCELCDTVFHRRETMIAHIKWHELKQSTPGDHVCKTCGEIACSEQELWDHGNRMHYKNHTCYYCGRMYKGKVSFDKHIEKHEKYMKIREMKNKHPDKRVEVVTAPAPSKPFTCETCGRSFLGERALMWHNRLHTDERPYTCDVCGRGFVSENRRNQHSLCAHTVPTRRCPLCPALFHLRSMVNTHIKKVHLKGHKRRNRTVRHQPVYWDTQPVPIQELSVSIQNEILELQTARGNDPAQYI